jgi:hypothetical protein
LIVTLFYVCSTLLVDLVGLLVTLVGYVYTVVRWLRAVVTFAVCYLRC